MKTDLQAVHSRGLRFLETRRAMLAEAGQRSAEWSDLAKLGRDRQAKRLRDQLATRFSMNNRDYLQAVQFAAAVETIVGNCGEYARGLLLDGKHRQTAKGILSLSRTSDTRQRYRVAGVRAGRFRSVAPQNDDAVFDTVTFSEVPSRLRRGRGALDRLQGELHGASGGIRDESYRLVASCREAARVLRVLVVADSRLSTAIPDHLRKDRVLPYLQSRVVGGKVTGRARLALRLTIKSVWDYPEICERGILPSEVERRRTIDETAAIIAIADEILHL
jgi:hypothetical protein